jgi:hypothetical protein
MKIEHNPDHLVLTKQIGNVTCCIYDTAYRDKTPEELRRVMEGGRFRIIPVGEVEEAHAAAEEESIHID